MKLFAIFLSVLFVFCLGLFLLTRGVTEKPAVRPGQEEAYAAARELLLQPTPNIEDDKLPRAVCVESSFDFGLMAPGSEGSHSFEITNAGDADLILRDGGTSCKCTMTDMGIVKLPPGTSHTIQLKWAIQDAQSEFAQYALVKTNDPHQLEIQLGVRGQVGTWLGSNLEALQFDRLIQSSKDTKEFEVFSTQLAGFELQRWEASSELIQLEDLGASQPEGDKKHVHRFRLKVQAPDSLGARAETVRIYMNGPPPDSHQLTAKALQPDGTWLVEVPVYLDVLRKLSLYGPSITDDGRIDLGKTLASQSAGRSWVLLGRIRGAKTTAPVTAKLSGIPELSVEVVPLASREFEESFRLVMRSSDKMRAGIYDHETAGTLVIEAPGIEGEERIEMTVNLDVLADQISATL